MGVSAYICPQWPASGLRRLLVERERFRIERTVWGMLSLYDDSKTTLPCLGSFDSWRALGTYLNKVETK